MALWAVQRTFARAAEHEPGHETDHESEAAAMPPAAQIDTLEPYQLAQVSAAAYQNGIDVWDEFIAEVKRGGKPPILVLFPDKTRVGDDGRWDYVRPTTKALHERMARHFEERGAIVIRGTDMLQRHTERYGARPWTKWKNYMSEEAHKTLAELLAVRVRAVLGSDRP